MKITRTSVSGVGIMHDCYTRTGAHFRVLEDNLGSRTLYVYGSPDENIALSPDEAFVAIELEEDEADQLANLLHSRPIPDRVAELERQLTQLTEESN